MGYFNFSEQLSLGPHAPLVTSFGVTFCGSSDKKKAEDKCTTDDVIMLMDPTLEEEEGVCDVGGVISVTVVGPTNCNVSRAAGVPLSAQIIAQCCNNAKQRAQAVNELLPSSNENS